MRFGIFYALKYGVTVLKLKHKLAILFFAISFFPALIITVLTYRDYAKTFEKDELGSLNHIANYKATEIKLYFDNVAGNIRSMQSSWCIKENLPIIIKHFNDRASPAFISARKILDERFQPTQETRGLIDIMLVDTNGIVVYGTNREHAHVGGPVGDPGNKAFEEGSKGIYVTDVFPDQDGNKRYRLLISAPYLTSDGALLGVILFEINPDSIFKLTEDFTGLGKTGETLLGMREDDNAIYLNPLRHDPKSAFSKRIRIGSNIAIPIQKAVQGEDGSGYSIDYRGVKVIAAWRYIPSIRWGLVAKIDIAEALKPLDSLKNILVFIFFLLFILCWSISYLIAITLARYHDNLDGLVKERTAQISTLNRNIEFILGATKTGLDIIDPDYNMVYIDPEWQKIYGNPKGKKCYEYFMGRNTACPACGIRKAFETKKPVITEEVLLKEGNRPIQVTTIPYQDAKGNWLVAEINVDISNIKEAEKKIEKYQHHLEELVKERTQQLMESEELFRLLFDEATDGFLVVDTGTRRFKMVNNAICQALGYTKEELLNLRVDDIHPVDALPKVLKEFELQASGAIKLASALPVQRKDRSIFYADVSTTHIIVSGEEYMMGSFRDITERIKTEEILQASETRYRRLFESAKDGILILDAGSGTIVDANPFIKDLLGYPSDELVGKELWEIGTFKDIADSKESFLELQNKGYIRYENLPLQTKDGQTKEVEFVSNRYKVDHVEVLQCNIRDITERRKAEAALTISEANYRAIFESASDAITVRDIESYAIVDANEQACELFCYPKEELLTIPPEKLFSDEDPNSWKYVKPIYEKAASGEPQSVELLLKDKAGRTFWVESHIKRSIIGGSYRILTIAHDISERKDSEDKIRQLNSSIAKANEELKRLALIDAHTGLYNYHYYNSVIDSEFARAQRQDSKLSLIMMDIDYFKSINDVYGHPFGDLILKQFAELLKKTVRLYDTVVRFGGEEFIVIAPGAGDKEAMALGKRIISAVESFNFGDSKNKVKLKISAAVGSYPDDSGIKTSQDFISIADHILGKAKEEGGNRVYSSLDGKSPTSGKLSEKEPSIISLKDKIQKLTARSNQSVAEAIFAFAKTIELKDRYTGEHVDDTMHYAVMIAEKLGLPDHEIEIVKYAAALHDLGKVGIPEAILHKTGKLSEKEIDMIRLHPQIGVDIVRPIHFLHDIIPAMLHHHERWDGSGYPTGLKKESIPLGARIVAVADAYQAMTSDRPYRNALSHEKAKDSLKKGSGTQFDPKIVDIFLAILSSEKKSSGHRKG